MLAIRAFHVHGLDRIVVFHQGAGCGVVQSLNQFEVLFLKVQVVTQGVQVQGEGLKRGEGFHFC